MERLSGAVVPQDNYPTRTVIFGAAHAEDIRSIVCSSISNQGAGHKNKKGTMWQAQLIGRPMTKPDTIHTEFPSVTNKRASKTLPVRCIIVTVVRVAP